MKTSTLFKVAIMAAIVSFASCRSHKTNQTEVPQPMSVGQQELFNKMSKLIDKDLLFVCSKVKFSVSMGEQNISLTGNLRMKRNAVIQLQLMAFGFVEAARLEFTPEDLLLIDRINKQYIKVPYYYVDFLRNSDINFNTLQSLFWDEIFLPGSKSNDTLLLNKYVTTVLDEESIVTYRDADSIKSKMFYSWLVNNGSGRVKMANIMYRDSINGNTQMNWDYQEFKELNKKLFPSDMQVTLTLPTKEVRMGIKLNYLKTDSDWDYPTPVSTKYRRVDIDEMLRRFMSI